MSLTLRKELADIKEASVKLSANYSKIILPARQQALTDAQDQFSLFFKEQGFDINKNPNGLQAKYKGSEITLTNTDPKEQFLGADVNLTITDNPGNKTYEIRMIRVRATTTSAHFGEIRSTSSEAEKLAYQIAREKETFEQLQKNHDEALKGVTFKFTYAETTVKYHRMGDPKPPSHDKYFDSMNALLQAIFN